VIVDPAYSGSAYRFDILCDLGFHAHLWLQIVVVWYVYANEDLQNGTIGSRGGSGLLAFLSAFECGFSSFWYCTRLIFYFFSQSDGTHGLIVRWSSS